jgi:NTP pyrophosphatase (non-canonical NTP hydrolase)
MYVIDVDTYQELAMEFRLPTADRQYALLNLAAEAGEVLGKAAKLRRDGGDVEEYNNAIKKELGDVMWQIAAVAEDHGFPLSEVCQHNLDKLWGRKDKGTLQGSGDLR